MNKYELITYEGSAWVTEEVEASDFVLKEDFLIFLDADGENFYTIQSEYWVSVKWLGTLKDDA